MAYKRPTMQINGKQVLVSRVVAARMLGRALTKVDIVHHKNHDPYDNRPENLEIISRAEHKKRHPEIGMTTRIQKQWHFDPGEIACLFRRMNASAIAKRYGCHYKTIIRVLKTTEEWSKVDLRSLGRAGPAADRALPSEEVL